MVALAFLIVCVGAAATVGIASWWSHESARRELQKKDAEAREKEESARDKLAFRSLRDRLPKGKAQSAPRPLPQASAKRLTIRELQLDYDQENRPELLKGLHEKTRRFFVESPGFGSGRLIRIHSDEQILLDEGKDRSPPEQPGSPASFSISSGGFVRIVDPEEDHYWYHEDSIHDFINPISLGYVKDREHVSGFSAHGFRHLRIPLSPSKRLRIHHILLVGLLTTEKPRVYLSDNLPSMVQARTGQTRALDDFEEVGLEFLRRGEDLYVIQEEETLRMFGALRAAKQCLSCHDAERGDLLGAFSYTLRTMPPHSAP
jgi:hypothetical protein